MKLRTIFLTAAIALFGVQLCSAQDNMGTWKFNEAKSKIPGGSGHTATVSYTAEGDQIKVVNDGVDGKGNPTHSEWVGKFDGKDYPVTGSTAADSRSYKQIDAHTLLLTNKKDGKVTSTARIVTGPDGNSRTVHISSNDASGETRTATLFYDKQ